MKTEHKFSKYNFFIIRGCPGSGKSTAAKNLAKKLEGETQIFETDDYFVLQGNGEYKFDANKLGAAHRWNFNRFTQAVDKRVQNIILANTCTKASEFREYVIYAKNAGYNISIIEPKTPWSFDAQECFKRNIHNVPLSTIQKMLARYEHNLTVEGVISGKVG